MTRARSVDKYLQRYAEPTARWSRSLPQRHYEAALVVPVFDENVATWERLTRSDPGFPCLLVLVVNAPETASRASLTRTQRFLTSVRGRAGQAGENRGEHPLELLEASRLGTPNIDCLLIDALGPSYRLARKEGVGRARKMGCDAALSLWARGDIAPSFLGSSDADVYVHAQYFKQLRTPPGRASCLSYRYRHDLNCTPQTARAMCLVEAQFRLYVLGLARAGSPYAYHSLGSALAVDYQRYAEVRGVPNREAGEDFYLLNKLVKLAPLCRLSAPPLLIDSRLSQRVPFGTGPSLNRVLDLGTEAERLRDPKVFETLGAFLFWMTTSVKDCAPRFRSATPALPAWLLAEVEACWSRLKPELAACPSSGHRLRRFHERFDALATLQFIHRREVRDLPALPPDQALAPLRLTWSDPVATLRALQDMEEALPPWQGPTTLLHSQSSHPWRSDTPDTY